MLADLRYLWRTRKSSGFPWPFQGYRGREIFWGRPAWMSKRRRWQGLLEAPFRPYRYLRMVRMIAKVRRLPYAPSLYDEVA